MRALQRERPFAVGTDIAWRSRPGGAVGYAFACRVLRDARLIHATAASAVDDLVQRRWPFDEATWSELRPQQLLTPAKLPDGWDLG